jgi:hypothetical protein
MRNCFGSLWNRIVIEATGCAAVVTRNAASTDDETIVDNYIRNLRPADILADSQPTLYVQILGGHDASLATKGYA